jgi:heme A synthase
MAQPSSSTPALDSALSRHTPQPTTFQRLAVLTTVFAYTQIVLGAIVRVSGSGLGCGDDWPLCRGHLLPPLNAQAIVEYAHRTVGSLTGVLLIVTMVVGWLTFRHSQPLLLRLIVAAVGLALYTTFHRLAAGLIGFFLLLTLSMVLRQRRPVPWQRTCACATLVLLLIQIGSGYLTATDHTLSFIAAFHVAIATAIWCGIVVTTGLAHRPGTPVPGDDGTTARTAV